MLSQYNGRHRTTSDAYLQAGRLTALVAGAAFTVVAGSAAAAAASRPDTVALVSATQTIPSAFVSRNAALYVSRSSYRAGFPQDTLEVTPAGGLSVLDTAQGQEDLRVATAKAAHATRVARTVRTKAAQAMDVRKARAVAAQIAAVEAAIDAKRATRPSPAPSTASTAAAKKWAAREVTRMGYEPVQFTCLVRLWTRESGWNPLADNPTSTAYGIPQALPGSKMASAGADWRTNPKTQMAWGLGYIKARYGDPCHAWAHSEEDNWY